MLSKRKTIAALAGLLLPLLPLGAVGKTQEKKQAGPDPNVWDKTVEKAVAYLKSTQAEDGTWSKAANPAITGLVLTGLFRSGKVTATEPVAAKALKFVETLVDPKEGHIAGLGAKVNLHNYGTCVNLIAFQEAKESKKYAAIIANAAAYLKKLQWDETEGKTTADAVYGGAGYGGGARPDLSNTQFFLDALVAAGIPRNDPAFQKALIYVSRCQNWKSEFNDQPWAAKINDGSFIYGAGPAGETRGAVTDDGTRPGYGSMTYAGVKCLILCGEPKSDARCQKALEWLGQHYSVDLNPGMPDGSGQRGLYYYLETMAKCLDLLGVDQVVSADGKKHDWRADIIASLANRQRKDGSWGNEIGSWMEANPDLCTAYALVALSYCKPKVQ
jgi:squalene-hopene/tetraprenyl-beta-curcumene cyclase